MTPATTTSVAARERERELRKLGLRTRVRSSYQQTCGASDAYYATSVACLRVCVCID